MTIGIAIAISIFIKIAILLEKQINFEIAALFHSPNRRVKKRSNFKPIFYDQMKSFLYCLTSNALPCTGSTIYCWLMDRCDALFTFFSIFQHTVPKWADCRITSRFHKAGNSNLSAKLQDLRRHESHGSKMADLYATKFALALKIRGKLHTDLL